MENKQQYKAILRIVIIGILLYSALQHYTLVLDILAQCLNLFFPFLLGAAIAFVLNVPMRKIEKTLFGKTKARTSFTRLASFLLTLVLVLGVLFLAMGVIIPQIGITISMIYERVPDAYNSFLSWLDNVTQNMPDVQSYVQTYLQNIHIDWNEISSYAINILKTASSTIFSSGFFLVTGIFSSVITAMIAFIFSIYILFQKEMLAAQAKKIIYAFFKEEKAEFLVHVGTLSNKIFRNFLAGQCTEAFILFCMFFLTLWALKLPYATLIGVLIGLSSLVPVIGMFVGCAIGAFLIVMVNPMQALWFIIVFLVLQQIETNLIYPHVVGSSIGLPPVWLLLSVMVGGSLFGIAGILIFIPFCSVLYALIRESVYKHLEAKKVPESKWAPYPEVPSESKLKHNLDVLKNQTINTVNHMHLKDSEESENKPSKKETGSNSTSPNKKHKK